MLTWAEPYWLTTVAVTWVVLGLGFLLFIHEFGHFIVAKRAGVKVEVFSLGMCHFLLTWTRKGTVYALSWLPVGGYVRMAGQQDLAPPPGHKPLPHEYGAKRVSARMAIISAGVIMNFIGGYLCYSASLMWGREVSPAIVQKLDAHDLADKMALEAGLRDGDRIVAVNGDRVYSLLGLEMRVARIKPGSEMRLSVERLDGRAEVRLKTIESGRIRGTSAVPGLDVRPGQEVTLHAGFAAEDRLMITPLQKEFADKKYSGWDQLFMCGDLIESVNGQPCRDWKTFKQSLETSKGRMLEVVVRQPGAEQRRTVTLPVAKVPMVGIALGEGLIVREVAAGKPAEAAGLAPGDRICVESGSAGNLEEFHALIEASPNNSVQVTIRHPDGTERRNVTLTAVPEWYPAINGRKASLSTPIGVRPLVTEVRPGSMAAAKGLRDNDVILEVMRLSSEEEDGPISAVWAGAGRKRGPHRFEPARAGPTFTFPLPVQERLQLQPGEALAAGWSETVETILGTSVILKRMTSGQASSKALTGPIGIGQAAYNSAQEGLGNFLWLLGLLGVSLAFFNLLPIPVLDGGHLAFLAYEAVFRRAPSPKVVEYAQYAGLLVILALFALVFKNDISRMLHR